ncbi:uncharacterized protein CXorf65 homolog, partial [Actinia tenebrosa]|uniref:Uncharacterized protein CXorf65 homolog n=1 Tax=Actinia tenebrosa TaxID=6105 RepID=A0A6P8HVH0_ACTTE
MAFITVRFGDNEEELFNPNCVTLNLMDNIRRRCRCQRGVILDLSDEDGDLKNLPEYSNHYADKFLKARQKFVLIKIEKGSGESPTTYTSMLNDLETINPKLLSRLEALSKTVVDGKPKSGRKESMWTAANRMRKARAQGGGPTSAGRTRSESSGAKSDSRGSGQNSSPQNKGKTRKISRSS